MSQLSTTHKLEEIRHFLERVGHNQTMATSTDDDLRDICYKARNFGHDVADVIRDVRQHWEKEGH